MNRTLLLIAIAGLAIAGCAQTPLEADYGNSVRQMSENQVYDPATVLNPSRLAVEGADPDSLNAAVTAMRTQTVDRKHVNKPVLISIGGQGDQ